MSGSLNFPGASGDARIGNGNGSKSMRGGRSQGDALRRFGEAKKRMGDIFTDLESYVAELVDSFVQLSADYDFVQTTQVQEAQHNRNSITVIQGMFKRDHMKVVFFGRTSNGKSTVINAMLHSRVLPAGMGHTTSCFLQVEASPDDETFIMTEASKDRIGIEKLNALAHASSHDNKAKGSASMGDDSLVRIFWPKNDSKLLQNDVVLLDSPGVDVSPEFDSWIDKHCLDADVFVLVSNAEATLTQAEKSFFHRVSSKLSKPNVFILNNRWDASAAEPEQMEQVREQHMTQFRRFLVQDLQVCTNEEAKDRIFFISAREVLNNRAKNSLQSPNAILAEGHLLRAQDFQSFEQQFETCISKSAIRTKFEGHIRRGREIMVSLQKIVEAVHADALREKENRSLTHRSKLSELRQSQSSFLQFETKSRENADRLRAEVHVKVSADFHDEIRRLQSIIDNFDEKFVDDPACINEFKTRLTDFVDEQVTKELEIRCTGGLLERIMAAQRDMLGGVTGLLPEDYAGKVATVLQYRPGFRFSIAVNCHTLVDDFVEDLEFRFSFGLAALVRRYVAYRSGRPITTLSGQSTRNLMLGSSSMFPKPLSSSATSSPSRQSSTVKESSSSSDMQSLLAASAADDAMLNSIVLTTASYVANGGVGLLVVTGLVYRTVGWRVIAIGAGAYLGLYAFERLRWNAHAKEQHLKEQFRSHLACKMRQLASAHTNQCETQVVREMDEILKSLKATVAGVHNNMKTEVSKLQGDMENLDKITKELIVTKNKATFLSTNLDSFENDFLKPDSP